MKIKGKDSSRPARKDIPVISNESERSFPGLIAKEHATATKNESVLIQTRAAFHDLLSLVSFVDLVLQESVPFLATTSRAVLK